jgi:hypothetical protein
MWLSVSLVIKRFSVQISNSLALGKAFATWLSVCLKIERSKVQTPVIA